jgi:hypothetical protein
MRRKFTVALGICPVVIWALFGLFGKRISSGLASHYGARILAMGSGKFTDADRFVYMRLKDLALLATAACVLALAWVVAGAFARRLFSPRGQWIFQALSAFICLNCWAAVAAHTVLFWCVLFSGTGQTHNYTQYQIKQRLMNEIQSPSQAVLLGNSQTRAQIDEGILNEHLGSNIWTTELHFPGSLPYDMMLSLERLPPVKLDYVICYLSEGAFYAGVDSEALMFFFGFRDLADYRRLARNGAGVHLTLGLLGDLLPLFRLREPLAGRILGFGAQNIGQEQYDQALNRNLVQRARVVAATYRIGPESDFQKKAFTEFAQRCRHEHSRLIVCCGQLNPILEKTLDPALRPDMLAFLRGLADADANIVLLDENGLPRQTDADYDDLTHVNTNAQARFSEYIAGILGKLAQQKQPIGPSIPVNRQATP